MKENCMNREAQEFCLTQNTGHKCLEKLYLHESLLKKRTAG